MSQRMGLARVRAKNLKDELQIIGELRRIGSPFRMVSTTDYIVNMRQLDALKRKKIPFTRVKTVW